MQYAEEKKKRKRNGYNQRNSSTIMASRACKKDLQSGSVACLPLSCLS